MATRTPQHQPLPREYGQALALLAHPDRIARMSDADLAAYVYLMNVGYGLSCREDMIPRLQTLYGLFLDRFPDPEARRCNYALVMSEVFENRQAFNALLPYLFLDPDPGVASTAALDLAQVHPNRPGETLTGPQTVVDMVRRGAVRNPAAALGGLLMLGDQRVIDLVEPLRDRLTREQVQVLVQCQSGFLSHATLQFYVRWLGSRRGGYDDGIFGCLASFLYKAPGLAARPEVRDVERVFPATEDCCLKVKRTWTLPQYAALLRPALEAILRREPEPRILPAVFKAWGLPVPARPAQALPQPRPSPQRPPVKSTPGREKAGPWSVQ